MFKSQSELEDYLDEYGDEIPFSDEPQIQNSIPLNKKSKDFMKDKIKDGSSIEVTTIIKEKPNYSLKKPFAIVFTENFFNAIAAGVNQTEMKILAYIIDQMEYGNLISISQTAIAKNTGLKRSNVSYSFNNLIKKNILIKEDGNIFVNSNIISKGLSRRLEKSKFDNLKKAQKTTIRYEEAF